MDAFQDTVMDAYLSGSRGIVSSAPPDGGPPLMLTLETIEAAANDPRAIGQLMTDMAMAEGKDMTGCALYFEHGSEPARMLADYATGLEASITGGWVRCVTSAAQLKRERPQLARAAADGVLTIHGRHRGVLLVQFHAKREPAPRQSAQGFGQGVA